MVKILAIEGLDGAGKSTLWNQLVGSALLRESFFEVFPSRSTVPGACMRRALQAGRPVNPADAIADMNTIMDRYNPNDTVVCDRYILSTIAYGLQAGTITSTEEALFLLKQVPAPTLTVFLDVAPDEAKARIEQRGATEPGEADINKLTGVWHNYKYWLPHTPPNLLIPAEAPDPATLVINAWKELV